MTTQQQGTLQQLGFQRVYTGKGLAGERLWWRRTQTAMDIVRQRDGAEKHQDLGDGHPTLPADTRVSNRAWAIDLADDELVDWR